MRTILVIPRLKYDCNFWTAFRSAEAFGVNEIFLIGYDKGNFKIPKSGMKTDRHMALNYFDSVEKCMDNLAYHRISIISIENSGNAIPLSGYRFPANVALVMGNENSGVPRYILNRTIAIKIPQYGLVKCLNTSVAISIILFERFKQRLNI